MIRSFVVFSAMAVVLFLLGTAYTAWVKPQDQKSYAKVEVILEHSAAPVPVELFVMSKCPDAVHCETVFDHVLDRVKVPVALDVNYIAKLDHSQPYQFECKHGTSECLGNIQELCFKHVYPEQRTWFGFINCLNEHYDKIGLDEQLAKTCAQKLGKDYAPVQQCAFTQGINLLAKSVERTNSLNVSKSCTIFIDNKLRCIRDSTWKECSGGHSVDDFVKTIEDAYYRQ